MPAQAVPPRRLLRFDVFELNLQTQELRKRGVKLRLQGQPIQLLAILLESAGELVTRDELKAAVWPADTFVDFDHGLHNAIARIREALGDSASAPRYIETLPRRGYRFIGTVEEVEVEPVSSIVRVAENGAPVVPPARTTSPNPSLSSRVGLAIAVSLAALALARFRHVAAGSRAHARSHAPRRRGAAAGKPVR